MSLFAPDYTVASPQKAQPQPHATPSPASIGIEPRTLPALPSETLKGSRTSQTASGSSSSFYLQRASQSTTSVASTRSTMPSWIEKQPGSSPFYQQTQAASLSTTALVPKRTPSTSMTRSRAVSVSAASGSAASRLSLVPPVPPPKTPVPSAPLSRNSIQGVRRDHFDSFESCMEGGIKYETQSAAEGHSGDVAERYLNRAAGLFAAALSHQPDSAWATLRRATVLYRLALNASPVAAITNLREARQLLVSLGRATPNSASARETTAGVSSRLSHLLYVSHDQADDVEEVWEGEVGRFACEALEALEEVASERMDRVRSLRKEAFEGETPALADMFLALANAAGAVATLATDADIVDSHAELAEHALDQAANMATLAAAAKVRPPTTSAALITRVQLASGRAAAERLRHMFLLGVPLEEDDFTTLIADMTLLVKETRERTSRLKGSKGAAAAAQAFEAVRQLGDTKVLYANLLRCVWRERRERPLSPVEPGYSSNYSSMNSTPPTPGLVRADSIPGLDRSRPGSMSSVSEGIHSPPFAEDEDEADAKTTVLSVKDADAPPVPPKRHRAPPPPPLTLTGPPNVPLPALPPQLSPITPRTPLSPLNPSSTPGLTRRASDFAANTARRLSRGAAGFPFPPKMSWQATSSSPLSTSAVSPQLESKQAGPSSPTKLRRMSSASKPLNPWERKQSFYSPLVSPAFSYQNHVPTADLAQTAWSMLSSALKHYKVALTLLSQADVGSDRVRLKSEVLASIASASLFRASLAARIRRASAEQRDKDQPKALLNTAEVYSTWAAREVGWSFIIEGTPSAELADRRTDSWEADVEGKRAVLLTLRIWWYRATSDIGADKPTAKMNVARVVKRLRDLEGVSHGDVARFIASIARLEGDIDPVERLFWRSVKRILSGDDELM